MLWITSESLCKLDYISEWMASQKNKHWQSCQNIARHIATCYHVQVQVQVAFSSNMDKWKLWVKLREATWKHSKNRSRIKMCKSNSPTDSGTYNEEVETIRQRTNNSIKTYERLLQSVDPEKLLLISTRKQRHLREYCLVKKIS